MPATAHLSPAQSAQLVKLSRRTIMRAIEAGELSAFRDNRNRWQIIYQELERWAGTKCSLSGQGPSDAHYNAHIAHPDARLSEANQNESARDLAAARLTIAKLEARLDERAALVRAAEARAQAAEDLAQKLTNHLAAHAASEPVAALPPTPPPSRRWWPWRRS